MNVPYIISMNFIKICPKLITISTGDIVDKDGQALYRVQRGPHGDVCCCRAFAFSGGNGKSIKIPRN